MELKKTMRVLIVDDHKTMIRIIRNLLVQLGITNIEEAIDGNDALSKLKSNKFDLILSDWNMSPMTGLELLKQVRSNASYGHVETPFVMITAEAKPENVMEARKSGVDNYIVKPFNAETLESKIKAAMMKRAQPAG
jgi:two-component system chemotaxis response regulator CheY